MARRAAGNPAVFPMTQGGGTLVRRQAGRADGSSRAVASADDAGAVREASARNAARKRKGPRHRRGPPKDPRACAAQNRAVTVDEQALPSLLQTRKECSPLDIGPYCSSPSLGVEFVVESIVTLTLVVVAPLQTSFA